MVAGAVEGLRAGEVERRRLTADEVAAIIDGEITTRRALARRLADLGQPERAARLQAEAEALVKHTGRMGGQGHGHGHGHGHEHSGDWDWAARGQELLAEGDLFAPAVDQAVAWLAGRVPQAQLVIDVGSGPGVAACTFLEALPDARALAADGAAPLLDLARGRAEERGLAGRLATRVVQLPEGIADLPPADLVWVSGVVHHLPDPVGVLRALGGLLRPGGLLALREGGLPFRFLPDGQAPGLLPRLDAALEELTSAGDHPAGVIPSDVGWPTQLARAGLRHAGTRSFLLDLPPPLDGTARTWLHHRLGRLREMLGDRLGTDDIAALDRLLDPDAPDGVLHAPDVHILTAITVHTAQP